MSIKSELLELSTCLLADQLTKANVMSFELRPLWEDMPRIAGQAFTIRCGAGDNLMLHAAIHRAPAGSVIVVESADCDYAVAGGNVCHVALRQGIAGFVVDGVVRDRMEARQIKFPVFARGLSPIPGGKVNVDTFNDSPVTCGGVQVNPGDWVVADGEGIVVIPPARVADVVRAAQARALKESSTPIEVWEREHRRKIDEILIKKGIQLDTHSV